YVDMVTRDDRFRGLGGTFRTPPDPAKQDPTSAYMDGLASPPPPPVDLADRLELAALNEEKTLQQQKIVRAQRAERAREEQGQERERMAERQAEADRVRFEKVRKGGG
ncbi:hypothetical protein TeGR_g13857, partial [Tetraparma gracilis]